MMNHLPLEMRLAFNALCEKQKENESKQGSLTAQQILDEVE
jgi:hypothetical protein